MHQVCSGSICIKRLYQIASGGTKATLLRAEKDASGALRVNLYQAVVSDSQWGTKATLSRAEKDVSGRCGSICIKLLHQIASVGTKATLSRAEKDASGALRVNLYKAVVSDSQWGMLSPACQWNMAEGGGDGV